MAYNVELTDKCEIELLDDYEDLCEHRNKPDTPVEDEMQRYFLEMARKEGYVKSYSKKVYMTMEA